jgi:hypothetical protein
LIYAPAALLLAAVFATAMPDDDDDDHKPKRKGGSESSSGSSSQSSTSSKWKLIGWNDLGMHCMDGKDYSIYSILPPFNTFHAQLLDQSGKLVRNGSSVRLTYEAVADPTGSINRSTSGKTNFWNYVLPLYGVSVPPDAGLAGYRMPGASNTPQNMAFESTLSQFTAEGVPISPYDDGGQKNYYPLMRLTARSTSGSTLATTDIVLPVSDEMDCSSCHASGSVSLARPNAGWAFLADAEKDYKTNVLRLHDERQAGSPKYQAALQVAGYEPTGLSATVSGGKPILCARCHGSNALPGTGISGIAPLTTAIHKYHAHTTDPRNGLPLDAVDNRSGCYRCHPGSETKCLRGAMGNAVNADGTMTMQCQSCHGNMTAVGNPARKGWLDEPTCQNCHTGTATRNNGQIRFSSVFDGAGQLRTAVDNTFSTNANTPAAGLSLYRFSKGHGGLQCESCHGATHAEYPSSHTNDNLQNIRLQGYAGTLAECRACHSTDPKTISGGPHGLHPLGDYWVDKHEDAAEKNLGNCRNCHGTDLRGTVLSAALTDRSFRTEEGTFRFAKGSQIGCYSCHNGPRGF